MARRAKVTVVGSFAVGLTIRAPRFPVAGETLVGRDFQMGPGGKGSNQAVATARLGADSHLIARIGDDPLAAIARDLYRDEGVGADHVHPTPGYPTGAGVITLNDRGENHIVIDLGANLALSAGDVDAAEELIAASDAVFVVLEIPLAAAARALEIGRRHGKVTLLNPAPAQTLDDALLANVDILTPNEGELRVLAGLSPEEPADDTALARELLRRGAGAVVATRGVHGAVVVAGSSRAPAFAVPGAAVDVVDTTGAGDAFSAALGVARAEGQSLVDAACFAVAAGALACTKLGVVPALPARASVDALNGSIVARSVDFF